MVSILRSESIHGREGLPSAPRPWERTGSIDVELLAQWAYGAQMVDRFERTGLHAIEAAAAGFEHAGYSACGVGQLMEINHLGCRVDRGHGIVRDTCHAAAYALACELAFLEHGNRVRFHAKAATRPVAWRAPQHKAEAAAWVIPWEVAEIEYIGPGRKGGHCQVIFTWDQRLQDWGREDYRRWWTALADLAWRLSQRALGFTVTGPAAPAQPWLDAALQAEGAPPSGSSQPTPPQ